MDIRVRPVGPRLRTLPTPPHRFSNGCTHHRMGTSATPWSVGAWSVRRADCSVDHWSLFGRCPMGLTGCLPSTRRARDAAPTTEPLGEAPVHWARRTVRALTPVPRDGQSLTSSRWLLRCASRRSLEHLSVVNREGRRSAPYAGGWSRRVTEQEPDSSRPMLLRVDVRPPEPDHVAGRRSAGSARRPPARLTRSLGPGEAGTIPMMSTGTDRPVKVAARARARPARGNRARRPRGALALLTGLQTREEPPRD